MPQMAPMLWLILFFLFLISLLCFLISNYFLIPASKVPYPGVLSSVTAKPWKW
uniref:ATP synthase complex subunit 8 n=1 Tax=Thenus orientalis TaxID=57071 RepID=A0A068W6Z4_THEOI|nr:ATP synthase F0 subunit 8 [Thenus orientalis]CDR98450.1 ATP synthase F0 subunit 8 [Thenus orientalis]